MRRSKRFAPLLLLLLVCPALAWAQSAGEPSRNVGVVTTLAGNATVVRAALPGPQPLRFKDNVFLRDRITTAERSIVRVLLGGKALVTVRELSALTITEDIGRSTIDLSSGKIAMGILRQRMRPGEVIEIRTPNAIAAIRGTVLVVELIPEPGGSSGAPRYTTKVSVLHGLVEVSDPKNPGAPPAQVGTLESWSRTGSDPSALVPMSPAAAEQAFAGLHSAPQIAEGPREFIQSVTMREQAKAVAVAEFLAPEAVGAGAGGDNSGPATPPSAGATTTGIADAPVIPAITSVASPAGAGGRAGYPTRLARFALDGGVVNQPGSFYSLSRGLTDSPAVPILEATNSSLTLGQSLMEISGATFSSTGSAPLLYLDPTTLNAASLLTLSGGGQFNLVGSLFQDQNGTLALSSDFLRLSGVGTTFAGSGASALVDLVGSSASTAGGLLSVSSGAVMDLVKASAPLLSLTRNAALVTGNNLADISGGATVTLSQLASLSASNLVVQGHALSLSGGARMTVAGDLFRLADRSTLTIANGALLSLSGGAILNVGGALINFIGTGNTLNITNTLCGGGCTMVSGLPVLVTGGGTLTLTTNPILNLTGNVLNIAPGAAAITISGGAQVKQGP
jgi:FecR-like protein